MLCEAQNYVKLISFTSELSFIFSLWSIFYCT
jgi:restriction endonuclease